MSGEIFGSVNNIGELRLVEVFAYYDEPILFLCATEDAANYLFLRLGTDTKEWIASQVSDKTLKELKSNSIELRRPFAEPEDGTVYHISGDEFPMTCSSVSSSELTEDMLPYPGEYLDYENAEPDREDVADIAEREDKSIIELSFEKNDEHDHEISCTTLGKTLESIQTLVYSLADKEKRYYGKFPSGIRKQYELFVTSTYAASFGVQIKSKRYTNCEIRENSESVITRLSTLFDTNMDGNKLKGLLNDESSRTAAYYYKFLREMRSNNLGFSFHFAGPNTGTLSGHLSTNQVDDRLKLIANDLKSISRVDEYMGVLKKIDVENDKFTFIAEIGDVESKISGKIDKRLRDNSFTVPSRTRVKVENTIMFDRLTGKEKYRFLLLGIDNV